ncbi:MAG: hypothetical protein COZ80_02275 [Ignavibacteria bacterium CG_4_8_14_3_um_filter_37_9]|nr:MAG: hypothetical protein AUJ54_02645 [Ignavibacteria bacterium CG1_02_37_35]PIS45719.1 MAG: hypothetical protein COT22_03795 [Ignavibacteria bacterium CG08_land_8_20_14_0_20_37_9]PIX00032.1 MAG: hypothetical protein COZ80_02275 [Ignavibacteria bacterium CG_4_8_14_3_um_filter_37_9]PIX95222.1 MAG: hypothetical protein COZ25_01530 [Ignavibacteria bacterium CG_4_10_14_3_um_filter_37_18]
METKVKKKSSFFRKLIIALITLSKAYKLKLISEEKMEKESKIIKCTGYKNIVWARNEDFPDEGEDDYFSPSKWYGK